MSSHSDKNHTTSDHRKSSHSGKPSRAQAEEAVRTLLAWSGANMSDPDFRKTPQNVVDAYETYFRGYHESSQDFLRDQDTACLFPSGTSDTDEGSQMSWPDASRDCGKDMVLVKDIPFYSHCKHHMVPFIGKACIAYYPDRRVIGFSRLVRVLEVYARRLQIQENLGRELVQALHKGLSPKGIAVALKAQHLCMSLRGVEKRETVVLTTHFDGIFTEQYALQTHFLTLCGA